MNHINILHLAKAYNKEHVGVYDKRFKDVITIDVVTETKNLMNLLIKETLGYCGECIHDNNKRQINILDLPYKLIMNFICLDTDRGTMLYGYHSDIIIYYYQKFNSNILAELLPKLMKDGKFLTIPLHPYNNFITEMDFNSLIELNHNVDTELEKRRLSLWVKQEQLEVL